MGEYFDCLKPEKRELPDPYDLKMTILKARIKVSTTYPIKTDN